MVARPDAQARQETELEKKDKSLVAKGELANEWKEGAAQQQRLI